MTYICKSSDGRALYHLPTVGRRRIYRRKIGETNSPFPGLDLLEYDTLEYAEKVCEDINERTGDDFAPHKISKYEKRKETSGSKD